MDPVTTSDAPETKLHFLDYWRIIRLRRSLILVVFLLCVMTSTLLTIWLPKQYASMVRIQVEKDAPEVPMAEVRQTTVGADPYFLTTQFKVIESYSILTNVIANLHLDEKLATQNGYPRWSMDETFDYLSKRISVEQTRMTSLIEISARNPDPQLAAAIVNGIAESYKNARLQAWKGTRGRGIEKFREKYVETQRELNAAETNLSELRLKLDIGEFSDQSPISGTIESEALREWAHDRVMAAADYAIYSNILAKLLSIPTNQLGSELATAYPQHTDPELAEYAVRLAQAKDRMTQVKADYGEQLPAYKTSQQFLEHAQREYDAKIEGIINGIKVRVEEDKANLEIIETNEAAIKTERNELARKYQPYYSAKAQLETLRRERDLLQTRLMVEETEQEQPNENIVIVRDPGRPEKRPVSPKSTVIIPLGVIVGLVVGLGLAFFIEYLDTSVKTIDDVERALQAPVLGVIPQNVGVILDEGRESPHAEAYRVLRTNLLFSRKNENWNTISVLSGGAGEGKSTTLFNLATIFAQNGQRVLVVDSDLRRPTLHKVLHVSNTMGLTDFLLKQRSLDEVIQKTKVPTMDFLASGKLPSSSMSILGSPQMKETIQELKRRYDFIFFDSPPLLGISDASVLASEMDMVLQVIQYRRYPQPMTLRAKQMILKVGGNLVGIVLNNINMSQDESYYYYSGYYEYQSQQKDRTVVEVNEAAKPAKIEIEQKY
jgi:capsular exopolysaccharide synthesis family protein